MEHKPNGQWNSVCVIELHKLFLQWQMVQSVRKNSEGHNIQYVMERPCLHLYWLSVSHVRRPHIWLLLEHTVSASYSVCCLYSPDQTQHSSLSSSRSRGQMAVQPASCQIYNIQEALRHILMFPQHSAWQTVASPGGCNLPHWPWGCSVLHCVI